MKTKLATLTLCIGLSACSIFPSRFDSQEHAKLVDIHVISKDSSACQRNDIAQALVEVMYKDAEWVWHYGQDLPNNDKMSAMQQNLLQMTKEFHERYKQSEPVSAFYCRSKFENIHKATDTIIKVSARRPRI